MKERPILFQGAMVRAILKGSKTQTRRIVKPAPPSNTVAMGRWQDPGPEPAYWAFMRDGPAEPDHPFGGAELHGEPWRCPYGQPGDRLWVRETWAIVPRTAYARSDGVQQTLRPDDDHDAVIYRAGWDRSDSGFRWRPSIHMPRWASRITLEITGVRVERLQDISEADAIAEGIEPDVQPGDSVPLWRNYRTGNTTASPAYSYESLWESINGPGSWDDNPFVWVVEFKRAM